MKVPQDKLTYNIYVISRCTHKFFAREMKKIGVTLGQFSFLLEIHQHPGISQEKLSGQLMISKSTTASIIRQLLESGLIRRITDPDDKRNYNLSLTEKGEILIPEIEKTVQVCHEKMMDGMTPSEQTHAFSQIARIRENAMKNLKKRK